MNIHVVVFFLLFNGGSVRVDRDYPGSILNDEECEVMAYDVMNELLGEKNPLGHGQVDMSKVKAVRYNCEWII